MIKRLLICVESTLSMPRWNKIHSRRRAHAPAVMATDRLEPERTANRLFGNEPRIEMPGAVKSG